MKTVAFAVSLGFVACGLLADSGERASGERVPVRDDAGDAPADARADAKTVVADAATVTDAAPPGSKCAAIGGKCVAGRSANCPAGTQPTQDIHADCMPETASRGYFCCVPAPPSACADDDKRLDCFATECESCWVAVAPSTSTCAGGRTCCAYSCPD